MQKHTVADGGAIRRGRENDVKRRVHDVAYGSDAAVYPDGGQIGGARHDGAGARHHAERAFGRRRQHKAYRGDRPHEADKRARSFSYDAPRKHHGEHRYGTRQAHAENSEKNFGQDIGKAIHAHSSFASSIIRCIAAISSGVSRLLSENAARNDGSEPPNTSSTKRALCIA